MSLFFQLLTVGLLAGIAYYLQAIAFDFAAIRRSELPEIIGELKNANRLSAEILAVLLKTRPPLPSHHLGAGPVITRVRRGGGHHIGLSDGEFMVWSWRDNAWQPLSVPPGFTPGPPPEFDGAYDGESISVWLPRAES